MKTRLKIRCLTAALMVLIVAVLAYAGSNSSSSSVRSLLREQIIGGTGPENEGFDVEARIVSQGDAAVPQLIDAIQTRDSKLADWYSVLYARLPGRISQALPAPVTPRQIRFAAMQILTHHFESKARPALPALIALSHSRDALERDSVVGSLCDLGTVASDARPRLVELLGDPDEFVSIHAAKALNQFDAGSPELRKALQRHLNSANPLVYSEAFGMYPKDEPGLAVIIPVLKQMLAGKDRARAAFATNFLRSSDMATKEPAIRLLESHD